MKKKLSTEEMISRWENQREVQNLMGRYTNEMLRKNEKAVFELFWTKNSEPCLGLNNGYYVGAKAVSGYYEARRQGNLIKSQCIAARFPEKTADLTAEELYGVGQLNFIPLTSPYVKIASDGKTAKGMWLCQGCDTDILASGPESFWTVGCLAGDFVFENGQWRIWHLLHLEDVRTSMGRRWDDKRTRKTEPGFEALEGLALPEPNVPCKLREYFSPDRPYTELPPIPQDYDAFEAAFSYGIER